MTESREPDCNHGHDVGRGDNLPVQQNPSVRLAMTAREQLQVGNDPTSRSDRRMHG